MNLSATIRREFPGPANAGLRRRLRQRVAVGLDPWVLHDTVALTGQGTERLRAVSRAYQEAHHRAEEGEG